jgi:uncharacterized membrane protein YfhO
LRGLAVPAGKHTIEFRFDPEGYKTGKMLTTVFSIVLVLLVLIAGFMEWRSNKTKG